MKVLVACEFSGRVREAFRKLGHDAWSCDIIPADDGSPYHIQGDVLEILDQGWDMMIAHPPCTYLTNAGARHLYPGGVLNKERWAEGVHAKELFMALYDAPIDRIAVENPIPGTIFGLPPYSQTIQPYQFGHPLQKRTCLWLKNLPPLVPTDIVEERQSSKTAGNWFNKGGKDRQKNRSVTFQGIADAMAAQWGAPPPRTKEGK